jgi:hypothetical protein
MQINHRVICIFNALIVGVLLALAMPEWMPWQRVLFNVLIFGGSWELRDESMDAEGNHALRDLLFDAIGAVMAESVMHTIIG